MNFDAVFDRVYPQLFRYLHRLTGSPDAAADVAQESFVRLLSRPMPEDEARRWLFTVAINLVRDGARTARTRERLLSAEPVGARAWAQPDELVERAERIDSVRAALEQIPERDRMILLMREEGFRYEEIARAVGVAPGSVGTLLARATRRFVQVYSGEKTGDESSD
ncbi:MAG: sigma-70 family RNA polymerase sigma factor [Gemmatimonadetes bacterium]|nr:sigma-70 family RNA polymerase sigma factor [Gemmatimonadota bacterium]